MVSRNRRSRIYVLAGTNGAGKSSILGAMLLARSAEYFNPDDASVRIRSRNPWITQAEANSFAWHEGKRLLERAIEERLDFAFETTLGGNTISALLQSALDVGIEVRIWYVGLRDVALHIERVNARARSGGHAIAEQTIRKRYDQSRYNLIRLLPKLTELRVLDNSEEADPRAGRVPEPLSILRMNQGRIVSMVNAAIAPEWTKPILAAAMKFERRKG